ncbi:MAG: UDP-N-acetylglucosamine 2-epimerase [Pseudomonadota bacterium]|nr:UDP-N-acetylglucosamine 2-epimerase [Pseudomonadota bacterium]
MAERARRICVVSGSRADYGLLLWPMKAIARAPDFELQVAVTGMHLAPEFGMTVDAFARDNLPVHARVESLLSGDSATAIAKSTGLGVIGFADAFARLQPDLVMLLGDRFEIFAAAQAALFHRIPVAHVCGGDVTEGAFDETMRHSITKIAALHFVSNADSAARVRQLGEDPARIFNVGSTGIDAIHRLERASPAEIEAALGQPLRARTLLVTFHPVTLDARGSLAQLEELLAALEAVGPDTGIVITHANADTEGRAINARLERFAADRPNVACVTSLGQRTYLSLMAMADAVVGNSSSGLYEAPSFGVPTVDIGDRQKGRMRAPSVIHVEPERDAIRAAIAAVLARGRGTPDNPYGDGHASARIIDTLRGIPDFAGLVCKRFVPLGESA